MALAERTPFIDFNLLKEQVGFEQVLAMLAVTHLKPHGAQLRGTCPICRNENPRSFVVTPGKGFYCFSCRSGGDAIRLVAAVTKTTQQQAAFAIARHFGIGTGAGRAGSEPATDVPHGNRSLNRSPSPGSDRRESLKPLDYLETGHEGLAGLEVSPETLARFGAGYAPKGILRGRLAIPIQVNGELVAYCGRRVKDDDSPLLTFPSNFDPTGALFNADRAEAGGMLYVSRDPLTVLRASESGVTSAIAFLADITPAGLRLLAALMEEKHYETVELF